MRAVTRYEQHEVIIYVRFLMNNSQFQGSAYYLTETSDFGQYRLKIRPVCFNMFYVFECVNVYVYFN